MYFSEKDLFLVFLKKFYFLLFFCSKLKTYMNKNNNTLPPSLFPPRKHNLFNNDHLKPKTRPISALLSLKIFKNDMGTDQRKITLKNFKKDLSLEHLQRQRINFNKTFILPEIEATTQSNMQYIQNLDNFYETINNEKQEEFLPFYILNSKKSEIIRKFICLNRKTLKTPRKQLFNKNLQDDLALLKPRKPKKKAGQFTKKLSEKTAKLDKSELEIIDLLLQKENAMNKDNFKRIFALTEKEQNPRFYKKNVSTHEKSLNTINLNTFNEGMFQKLTQKTDKVNFFQNHIEEIKKKASNSFHERKNFRSCQRS